jgi:hypothetical protein
MLLVEPGFCLDPLSDALPEIGAVNWPGPQQARPWTAAPCAGLTPVPQ